MSLSLLGTATRYFLEVARTGSVTQAAEQLHVAVSAVSRQVAKLEDSLGCALFERQARGMTLSAAGERLAAYVRTTMLDAERVVDEVKGLGGQRASRIRIACTEGFACGFMAEVMSSFRQAHPDSSIHLQVGTPDEVSRHLLRGEVDLGLKFSLTPEKGLKIEHNQPAPIMVLAAPGHALARRRSVSVVDIVRHPLAVPEVGTTVRQMLDLCCSVKGLHYQVAYTGNYATLLALTMQGEVLSLSALVSAAHAVRTGDLVAVPVSEPQLRQRSLQVLTLQGQTPGTPVIGFRDYLIEMALKRGQVRDGSTRKHHEQR